MKQILSFTKKECIESWRTFKLPILVIVFLIFGIMNPLFAKFTPELLKSLGDEAFQSLTLPEPTSLDSWAQFYKNITQMGLIIVALVFSGAVSQEISKGTFINLVTKGLARPAIIIGKYISQSVLWTACLFLCFAVTMGYTRFYFPDDLSRHLLQALLPLWIFGLLLLALVLFSSTITGKSYEGLLLTGAVIVVMMVVSMIKKLAFVNPLSLISKNMAFLQGTSTIIDYLPALVLTLLATIGLIVATICSLNRKKL
jgi:ABC-2 type transport system permease protein